MAGWRCRAAVLRVPGSWVDGWWSGWKRNGRDASEDGDDLIDPGPGWGNPKVSSSGAVGEPGGHVQQPVATGFGLLGGESAQAAVLGVADAVLDAGVGSVAGFQKCQLPGLVLVVNAW